MAKNVKRYLKDMTRDPNHNAGAGSSLPPPTDFVPVTYLLPADYSLFVEEFRRNPNAVWIMKPTARSLNASVCCAAFLTHD